MCECFGLGPQGGKGDEGVSKSSEVIAGVGLADRPRKSHWPARMDLAQSATGLLLGLFMWGHMFFVSTILITDSTASLSATRTCSITPTPACGGCKSMEPELAEQIYLLDRCIECGCCVAACGTARMREDFVGAVGLNRIARFRLDPRDTREDAAYYELIGDDSGVFGCMSLLACHDLCPKDLPLQTQIAFLRRKMVVAGLK